MATKVFMEALSPTMEEGRLVKWLKNEGDAVKSGDPLAEVETDKAIMELVARGDGVLRKRFVGEGDSRPVGQLVGVIAAPDENIDAIVAEAGAPASAAAVDTRRRLPGCRTHANPKDDRTAVVGVDWPRSDVLPHRRVRSHSRRRHAQSDGGARRRVQGLGQ